MASHGPLQVLHTGLSGEGETWTTVVMSAEGGMPPAAGDGVAGHGRTEAPRILPTLTEQQQSAHMKGGAKSNHPHPPHGKNTEMSYSVARQDPDPSFLQD